jgi:Na+-translocating ferredoxin:NAD+ oxidoreductase subunit G
MSKRKSTLINMLLTLVVITLISGFFLGYVNQITLEPKAKVAAERKIQALQAVLPEFDNDLMQDVIKVKSPNSADSIEIFKATKQGEIQGYAMIGSSNKGFSGLIQTMIGYKPDGSVINIVVLEQKETPGLGTKMKDEKFIKQFIGKNPETFNLKVKKDGGQVDALTGATITTRAFSETVQSSFELLKSHTEGFKNK